MRKPWGGRKLESALGRDDLPDGPIGESWDVADIPEHASIVENGPAAGATLREVWGAPYPLLVKVLDAQADLSVQLHPDGRDGALVKEEAWITLADGGRVALGSFAGRPVPQAGDWLRAMDTVDLVAGSPDSTTPPTMVHVPPGTVHAILGGSLVVEVQNPADVTWRLDDHGRLGLDGTPRDLHLDVARSVLARGPAERVGTARDGRSLQGRRFAVDLLPPGEHVLPEASCARVVFGTGLMHVRAAGHKLGVPGGRAVVLPTGSTHVRTAAWTVLASATTKP